MERRILKGKWKNVEYLFYVYDAKRKSDKIFSVVLFIMKESHKNINIYIDGLCSLINNVTTKFPEYNVRIYYDITSARYIKEYLNRHNIELYMYYFPQFFDQKMNCHYGYFGTLIRYLPLFNIKDHSSYQTIIFDVDNRLKYKSGEIVKFFDRNKDAKLIYRYRFCYLEDRILEIGTPYPIISSLVCQRGKLPQDIFINFLNDCLLNRCERYYNYVIKLYDVYDRETIYKYGIDEYFINHEYLNYYVKNNIPYMLAFFDADHFSGIKLWLEYLIKNNIKQTSEINRFINEIYKIIGKKIQNNGNFILKIEKLKNDIDKLDFFAKDKYLNDIINLIKNINPKKIKMPLIYYNCIINNNVYKKGIIKLITISANGKSIKNL